MEDPLEPLAAALNHADSLPFLFVGSGVSRRYLGHENFHDLLDWAAGLTDMPLPFYLAAAGDLPKAASAIAEEFYGTWWSEPKYLTSRRKWGNHCADKRSPLKFMVAKRLECAKLVASKELRAELALLGKCQIDGIITTNYDTLLEDTFKDFTVFVGQEDLLLSRSYQLGEIYKIHGSVAEPNGMVLCQEDYEKFAQASAYLVAKLMSVFVEHPIVFLGYSLSDPNIRVVLTSLMNCMSPEKVAEFKERFIWVDYEPGLPAPVVDDHLIDLGEGRFLPVLRVRTSSFAPVFDVLSKLERAVPLGLLRKLSQTVVEIVRSTDPTRYLSVKDLEDLSNVSDKTLVVGVAAGGPNGVGFRGYDRYDLIADTVVQNEGLKDYKAIVLELLPIILQQHPTAWTPVFKYVELSGLPAAEIPASVKEAMNKKMNAPYSAVPASISTTSNADLVTQHGVAKALNLVRSMSDANINVDQLESLIKDNLDQIRSASASIKTAIGQAAARLDRLRHGPAARKQAATPTARATGTKSAAAKTGSKVAQGAGASRAAPKAAASTVDPAVVRKWASDHGHEVGSRGRIPDAVLQAHKRRLGKD